VYQGGLEVKKTCKGKPYQKSFSKTVPETSEKKHEQRRGGKYHLKQVDKAAWDLDCEHLRSLENRASQRKGCITLLRGKKPLSQNSKATQQRRRKRERGKMMDQFWKH